MKLLTRSQFKTQVFGRDKHRCVTCGKPGVDAHHILERRLFPDAGYYIDNGATLCAACHLKAEKTTISVEMIRTCAGIQQKVLPPNLSPNVMYDKWGNVVNGDNSRTYGPLGCDEAMLKIINPRAIGITFI